MRLYSGENACECGKNDTVVCDWYTLLTGTLNAAKYMFAIEHTGSTVYYQVVGCEVGRVVGTTYNIYLQGLAEALA